MKFKYCIDCGKKVLTFKTFTGEAHWNPLFKMCRGLFVFSAPPEDRPDWDLDEPSPAELEIMNRNAEILMFDLRGLE